MQVKLTLARSMNKKTNNKYWLSFALLIIRNVWAGLVLRNDLSSKIHENQNMIYIFLSTCIFAWILYIWLLPQWTLYLNNKAILLMFANVAKLSLFQSIMLYIVSRCNFLPSINFDGQNNAYWLEFGYNWSDILILILHTGIYGRPPQIALSAILSSRHIVPKL